MRYISSKLTKLIILVLIMAIAFAGCQQTPATTINGTTTTAKGTTASVAGTTAKPSDRYGKYDKMIEVSIIQTDGVKGSTEVQYDPKNPLRAGPNENQWIKSYQEFLNIKLNRIIAEDGTALNANINTMMASGQLPDIMLVDKKVFYLLAENDVLQDIAKPIQTYTSTNGEWMRKVVESYSDDTIASGQIDGKWLGLPFATDLYNGTNLLWIRQDWLDKVNKKAPTTIDELVEVASAFKQAKLGGDDTIGLGVTGIEDDILSAYGVVMGTWTKLKDGTYKYANTLDEMKPGLLKMQELYKKGLIKSDFAVTNILNQEIANGKVGMYYAPAWNSVTSIRANLENDQTGRWITVDIPTLDGKRVNQFTNANIGSFLCVNTKCKYPEALLKLLEFELSKFYGPTAEELKTYFKCEDNYLMWNLRPFRNYGMTAQDLYKCQMQMDYLAKGYKADDPNINPMVSNTYPSAFTGKDWKGDKATIYNWGLYYVYFVGYPMVIKLRDADLLKGAYNGPLTENMTLYEGTINEALKNESLKVVMGADISVFENAVKTWYTTGGQKISDDVNKFYKK